MKQFSPVQFFFFFGELICSIALWNKVYSNNSKRDGQKRKRNIYVCTYIHIQEEKSTAVATVVIVVEDGIRI